jgi:hypothetical protein
MAVRSWNGTSDWLRVSVGGVAISNFAQGNYTMMAVVNPTSIGGTKAIMAVQDTAAADWLSVFVFNGTEQIGMTDEVNVYATTYTADLEAGDWSLVILRKTSGTTSIETGAALLGDATPTFGNTGATTTAGTAGTPNSIEFGAALNGSFSSFQPMLLATAAIWNSRLSDANINSVAAALTTQSMYDLSPLALWDFNQASTGTSVEDLIGTSDQSSINGTSVVTGDDPPGWTFGVGGGGGPAQQRRPRAQVSGWY